jgi:hypothetical protein
MLLLLIGAILFIRVEPKVRVCGFIRFNQQVRGPGRAGFFTPMFNSSVL